MCMRCVILGKMSAEELGKKQAEVIKHVDAQARFGHKLIAEFRKKLEENKFTQFEIGQMFLYEMAHVSVDNNFDVFMIIEEFKTKYMNFLELALNKSQRAEHPERFNKEGNRIPVDSHYELNTCPSEDEALKNMNVNDMAKA